MLNDSSNIVITGGAFHNVSYHKSTLDILRDNAAPGAFHDSDERYDAPKCHPETRTAVQEDIVNQVISALASCMIWLYGGAGAGKSAIGQSIASTCDASDKRQAILLGSFFFFRTAAFRNNAKRLGASLAYQLAVAIPESLPTIERCIGADPAIFQSNLEKQLTALFIQPLVAACAKSPTLQCRPRLIILDGLDECDTPDVQVHILRVLNKLLPLCPIRLVILIASRPEAHIQSAFIDLDSNPRIRIVHIGLNDQYDANHDIRLFLDSKFSSIVQKHRFKAFLPANWPDPKDVSIIVEKSSGHFIFAATIIRWVESDRHKPHERLSAALDAAIRFAKQVRDSPFKQLDALYLQIFSTIEDPGLSLAILYTRLTNDHATCPDDIEFRLRLARGDVDLHLSPLASLIRVEGRQKVIRVFHASLSDFLFDKSRSLEFYIEQSAVSTALCKAFLSHALDSEPEYQYWFDGLYQCSRHFSVADLDDQLLALIERLGTQVPKFLDEFPHDSYHLLVRNGYTGAASLSDLVSIIATIEDVMKHHKNESFQLYASFTDHMSKVMARNLSFCGSNRDSLDFLALLVFVDSHVQLTPHHSLPEAFGVDQACWSRFEKAHPFCNGRNPTKLPAFQCSDVLRTFLRDKTCAKDLHIEDGAFDRLAHKCVIFFASRSTTSYGSRNAGIEHLKVMFADWPHDSSHLTIGNLNYWWMVKALKSMLELAPWDLSLFEALREFDYHSALVDHQHKYVIEAIAAIQLYLETHRSMATTSQAPDHSASPPASPSSSVVREHEPDDSLPPPAHAYVTPPVTQLSSPPPSKRARLKRKFENLFRI